MDIKRGPIRRYIGANQSYLEHLVSGQVATDGVVYGAVLTIGTTGVNVMNQVVNPGFSMQNKEIHFAITTKFTELTGSVGSVNYSLQARSEFLDAQGSLYAPATYVPISGTYSKGVAASSTSEDTLSGYISVASLPGSPIRVILGASSTGASRLTGQIKNSSFVELAGLVIPGT